MKEINGRTYSFGILPPFEAIKVEVAIAKIIGEPLFSAFMDTKKTGATEEDAQKAGAAAIGLLMSRVNYEELIDTIKTVFVYVRVDGKPVDITADFNSRNKDLWLVFIEALKVNFSDFLPESLFASIRSAKQASS